MVERSEADRNAAVEAMYRIRAVESPPDASGRRTIWHRGSKGAALVSEVDGEGSVLRQELTLFDEQLTWERDRGFRGGAGAVKEGGAAANPAAAVLESAQGAPTPMLERAAGALGGYRGEDKLIAHLRELVVAAVKGRAPFSEPGEVTRKGRESRPALTQEAPPLPVGNRMVQGLLVGGLVLVIAGLALLLLR
ncbi:MAG: hypothetical protein AB1730_02455 [Myxococcota bacterium]|jgi:hypothetical protein